jgi:hypothetical protein
VFDNKEEALLFIKKNKKIRFKSFRNFQVRIKSRKTSDIYVLLRSAGIPPLQCSEKVLKSVFKIGNG